MGLIMKICDGFIVNRKMIFSQSLNEADVHFFYLGVPKVVFHSEAVIFLKSYFTP